MRPLNLFPLLLLLGLSACEPHWTGNAHDFAFTDLRTGEVKKLSSFVGKPVVLNFWADWSPPCGKEFPYFQEEIKTHPDGFELVSIADPTSKNPRAFVALNQFYWTFGQGINTLPSGAKAPDPTQLYNVNVIPTTVFIDRTGQVVSTVVGAIDQNRFETELAKIL